MANGPNKFRFTIDNVHYALLTRTVVQGVVSFAYSTPVHVPGTSNLDLKPEGDISTWRADGIAYYIGDNNSGYSGDWENAIFPDKMLEEVWNMVKKAGDNTLTEMAGTETKEIALLFRLRGDKFKRNVVMYRCTIGRPNIGSSGSTNNGEPQPQSVSIAAHAREDGKIRCCTTHETPDTVINGWYTNVYDPDLSEEEPDPEPDPEQNPSA